MKTLPALFLSSLIFVINFPTKAMMDTMVFDLSQYGLLPDTRQNSSPIFAKAIDQIAASIPTGNHATLILKKGRYDFFPDSSTIRTYYISNHDQPNPKKVGIAFENIADLTFDGKGSELIFHGRMLPMSIVGAERCTFKNFSVDFEIPHIAQATVVENNAAEGSITLEVAPWVNYTIRDSVWYHGGLDWEQQPTLGIAFEPHTRRLVYNSGDVAVNLKSVTELSPGVVKAHGWNNEKLVPGTILALRTWQRPAPGIFLYHGTGISFENINVHYAEGMGLLAQVSEDIKLDAFSVCLRGPDDPRYFTAQADATHFSGCKGVIVSENGLYEGMMDDAINIHGTYLKIIDKKNETTLIGEYMHGMSYGFEWGRVGDSVQFVSASTMENIGSRNSLTAIKAIDSDSYHGTKQFELHLSSPVSFDLDEQTSFGIENLEWTPEVLFANNIIRNNRARGALFSTPKRTIVERNLFDHTSGTAILLCGDCNGWYETGACTEVIIRDNTFVNALTSMFQFTNAVISIYPEIPNLADQRRYFHSGIRIENNRFEVFDKPILYAKSVDGLVFTDNVIRENEEFPTFHWNQHRFFFERVINYEVSNNRIENGRLLDSDFKLN